MPNKNKVYQIRLTEDVYELLEKEGLQRNVSVASIIRASINIYMKKNQFIRYNATHNNIQNEIENGK